MTNDDLNDLHQQVKSLDALLSEPETGLASWWLMLGRHCEWIAEFAGATTAELEGGDAE